MQLGRRQRKLQAGGLGGAVRTVAARRSHLDSCIYENMPLTCSVEAGGIEWEIISQILVSPDN